MHTHSILGHSKLTLTVMFLDSGKKLEYLGRTPHKQSLIRETLHLSFSLLACRASDHEI